MVMFTDHFRNPVNMALLMTVNGEVRHHMHNLSFRNFWQIARTIEWAASLELD